MAAFNAAPPAAGKHWVRLRSSKLGFEAPCDQSSSMSNVSRGSSEVSMISEASGSVPGSITAVVRDRRRILGIGTRFRYSQPSRRKKTTSATTTTTLLRTTPPLPRSPTEERPRLDDHQRRTDRRGDWLASGPALVLADGAMSGPLGTAGPDGPRATASAAGTFPSLGAGVGAGGGVPHTIRFQWRDPEGGALFTERVPFIREVLFGALGLKPEDLICAQRNNAQRFYDVTMASEAIYGRVLEQGSGLVDHPLGKNFVMVSMWRNNRRMVTTHVFNPFVSAESVRQLLQKYGEVQPGERCIRDELGVWNGRRQFLVDLREDGKGGLTHPPAYFSLGGNKGYLFYRGQPAFCRGCLRHGHEVSGCKDLACKNCLGKGHLAKDCKNPRRCRGCGGEGHLAHSCPGHVRSYATVLAGAGGGPETAAEGEEETIGSRQQPWNRSSRDLLPSGGQEPSPRPAPAAQAGGSPCPETQGETKKQEEEEGPRRKGKGQS
ncbi:hypothetical protein NFI96_009741 [Prochilodus magdalenae]|nr:hypothetical protein NFI96_009741 [Prochilodus magdalenae]